MHIVSTFQSSIRTLNADGCFSNNLYIKIDVLTDLYDVVETKKWQLDIKYSLFKDIPRDALKRGTLYKGVESE